MQPPDQGHAIPPGASPRSGLPPPQHTRWKKGQSGNPGGRPKGESITARLRRVLEQEHNGKALLDLLAERIAKEAISGKFPFAKEVWDRLEGRPVESHRVAVEQRSAEQVLAEMSDEEKEDLIRRAGLDRLPPPRPEPCPANGNPSSR